VSYLIDTNIIIGYFNDNEKIVKKLHSLRSVNEVLFISVITQIELLSLSDLSDYEIEVINKFLREFTVINLDSNVAVIASEIRRKTNLKLGDAIVTGSAILTKSTLLTMDKEILSKAQPHVECQTV
jgi:predicted nucleic acid-binding protein